MRTMIGTDTVILLVANILFFALLIYIVATSRRTSNELVFVTLVTVIVVAFTANICNIGIKTSEGLPVGEMSFSGTNLPPENINQVVKTVDREDPENSVYLTVVPYNNINGTRTLYKISLDDVETPINFSVGIRIVNNNGRIEQV